MLISWHFKSTKLLSLIHVIIFLKEEISLKQDQLIAKTDTIEKFKEFFVLFSGLCKSVQNSDKNRGPYFVSKELIYREKVGDSVTLACKVENLGESNAVWAKFGVIH